MDKVPKYVKPSLTVNVGMIKVEYARTNESRNVK